MTTDTDLHFPVLHRVHRKGWLNDPNGIMRANGRWHVYFQYNPGSARHEQICWGHMSSPDLVTWEEEPLGPRPRPGGPDAGGCWSGVGVLDRLGDGAPVPTLVYSAVDGIDNDLAQVVVTRLSADLTEQLDEGRVVAGLPDDVEPAAVRDPFLFEAFDRRWALQGAGIHRDGRVVPAVLLYACDDLDRWEYLGPMLTGEEPVSAEHAPAEIWECPQLVRVGDSWVLLLSLCYRPQVNPAVTVQVNYLVGDLRQDEAGRPRFAPRSGGRVDDGPDFYAPQAVVDGERILVWGWAWEGAQRTPAQTDAQGWAGCLTFPRELGLIGDVLISSAPGELAALRGRALSSRDGGGSSAVSAVELSPPVQAEIRAGGRVRVTRVTAGTAEEVLLEHDGGPAALFVDGSIVELLPEQAPSTTLRVYLGPGESLRVQGDLLEGWELRLPDGGAGTSAGGDLDRRLADEEAVGEPGGGRLPPLAR